MTSRRHDLTRFDPPPRFALRAAFEETFATYDVESPAAAGALERLSFEARVAGVSPADFDAALREFTGAPADVVAPGAWPVLERLRLAAARGYYSD